MTLMLFYSEKVIVTFYNSDIQRKLCENILKKIISMNISLREAFREHFPNWNFP